MAEVHRESLDHDQLDEHETDGQRAAVDDSPRLAGTSPTDPSQRQHDEQKGDRDDLKQRQCDGEGPQLEEGHAAEAEVL